MMQEFAVTKNMLINCMTSEGKKIAVGSPLATSIIENIRGSLKELLLEGSVDAIGKKFVSINITGVRLSNEYVVRYGRNVSPHSPGRMLGKVIQRRGRVLGWENWIDVLEGINDVLDAASIKAKVSSLNGSIVARTVDNGRVTSGEITDRYGSENVGSYMNPVYRVDAWAPEDEESLERYHRDIRNARFNNVESEC